MIAMPTLAQVADHIDRLAQNEADHGDCPWCHDKERSMSMSTFTEMAIEAFRKQEAARTRLNRAEAEVIKAARLVPAEEKELWFLHTELIRYEADAIEAVKMNDDESYLADQKMIADVRERIRQAEGRRSRKEQSNG